MMKKFLSIFLTALAGSAYTKTPEAYPVHRLQTGSGETVELVLINDGSMAIRYKGLNLYVDPVNVKGRCSYASLPKADYIFTTHDPGCVFKDLKLSDYEKGLELCLRAHALLPRLKSIGWDVAFTPQGPVLIEGNDDWEISPAQVVNGSLAVETKKHFGV